MNTSANGRQKSLLFNITHHWILIQISLIFNIKKTGGQNLFKLGITSDTKLTSALRKRKVEEGFDSNVQTDSSLCKITLCPEVTVTRY